MLRSGFWLIVLGLLAAGAAAHAQPAAGAAAHAQPAAPACPASEDIVVPDEPLEHVAAALAAGGPLNVLAIGTASTVGAPSSTTAGLPPGATFPHRMAEALVAARPQLKVQLSVRGGRGLTAEALLPQLRQALKTQKYQLVIWQTSTVEAVRGERPDTMLAALDQGIDLVQAAGADLILVDSQFSRFLRANTDLGTYEMVLQQVATVPGVVLFHRFDLMLDWAHAGQIDLERTSRKDRDRTIALLNQCVGEVLARFVLNGAELK